jgi:hypothetical protein
VTRSYKPSNDILDEFNERINALERLAKRIDNRFTVRVPTLDFNNPPKEATQNEIRIDSNTQSIYWYQEPDWVTVSAGGAGGEITWADVGIASPGFTPLVPAAPTIPTHPIVSPKKSGDAPG